MLCAQQWQHNERDATDNGVGDACAPHTLSAPAHVADFARGQATTRVASVAF